MGKKICLLQINMFLLCQLLLLFLLFSTSYTKAEQVILQDDFSTNTINNYTSLSIYFSPTRSSSDWFISGGALQNLPGRSGMLAFEDSMGNLLTTPDHFSISFSYTPVYPETQAPYNQDHPGIAFDRNATTAREFYLRPHSNELVGAYSSNENIVYATVKSTSSLVVHTAYNLFFEIDYITKTATSTIRSSNGTLINTTSFSGTEFTTAFGTNTHGAFGLVGFSTEGSIIDNLVAIDYTQTSIPEPSSFAALCFGIILCARLIKVKPIL